ncbi:hypothetical protein QBC43DRAFT_289893 [Cladorrhinum sp. PSN259]|nr:hypothetical protein QBC43DRAFT_289893 [Cladorrhinum sp. PSN259]
MSNNNTPSASPTKVQKDVATGSAYEEGLKAAREFLGQVRGTGIYRGPPNHSPRQVSTQTTTAHSHAGQARSPSQALNQNRLSSVGGAAFVYMSQPQAKSANITPSWLNNPRPALKPPSPTVRSGRRSPSRLRHETSCEFLPSVGSPSPSPRRGISTSTPLSGFVSPPPLARPPPSLAELRALNLSSTPRANHRLLRRFAACQEIVSTRLQPVNPSVSLQSHRDFSTSSRFPFEPDSPAPKPHPNSSPVNNTFTPCPSTVQPVDYSTNLDTWNDMLGGGGSKPTKQTILNTPSTTTTTANRDITPIPNVLVTGPSPPKDTPSVPARPHSRPRAASEPFISPTSTHHVKKEEEEQTPTRQRHMGVSRRMHPRLRNVTDAPITPWSSPPASGSVRGITVKVDPEEEGPGSSPTKGEAVRGKMEGDVKKKQKVDDAIDSTKKAENKSPGLVVLPTITQHPIRDEAPKKNNKKKKKKQDPESRVFYYQSSNSPPEAIKEQYRRFERQRDVSLAMGSGEGAAKVLVEEKTKDEEDERLQRLVEKKYPGSTENEKRKMVNVMKLALEDEKEKNKKETTRHQMAGGNLSAATSEQLDTMLRRCVSPGIMANPSRAASSTGMCMSRPTSPAKQSRFVSAAFAADRSVSSRPTSPLKQFRPGLHPAVISQPQSRNVTPLQQPPSRALSPRPPPPRNVTATPAPAPDDAKRPAQTPTMERIISLAHPRPPGNIMERNRKFQEAQKQQKKKEKGKQQRNIWGASGDSQASIWSDSPKAGSRLDETTATMMNDAQGKRDFSGGSDFSNGSGWSESE